MRYATMAGLAASWLTGNNEAGVAMYDPATGRGYDASQDRARSIAMPGPNRPSRRSTRCWR
ncbi:hypothetical protein [Rhodothermus marinus]|uniref:hypothetical protein n=1 Tax=Rhodothermus marinus TaxID=29549 RepID=UPI001FB29A78|nr:hypothetical protein [Rhodothermus marinus]